MKDEEGNDIQNNVVARFVLIFLFQLSEKIHIEAELEFSTNAEGETETELEYANMHYFFNDNTIITAGKFLLPFGHKGFIYLICQSILMATSLKSSSIRTYFPDCRLFYINSPCKLFRTFLIFSNNPETFETVFLFLN